MGFEGMVGAEVVNAEGQAVEATDDMLEGLRGRGGNLGIVTSLMIKAYPATKVRVIVSVKCSGSRRRYSLE